MHCIYIGIWTNNTHHGAISYCVVVIIIKITIVVLSCKYVDCMAMADRNILNGIDNEPNNVMLAYVNTGTLCKYIIINL